MESKQSPYLEGPEVGGSSSRSGLCDFRQALFNLVSLCFCFHKMEVRSSQLPQYVDHKSPGVVSVPQAAQLYEWGRGGGGAHTHGSFSLRLNLPVSTGW